MPNTPNTTDISVTSQMVDIAYPTAEVEVTYDTRTSTLWVNVDGICRLRVCKLDPSILVVSLPPKVHGPK